MDPRLNARPVLSLALRTFEFLFYHVLLSIVDRVARLPRTTMLPEAARLYRQNIALKAQLDALEDHLARIENKRSAKPLSVRAAQVVALLLTRGDEQFLRYFLSAPRATILPLRLESAVVERMDDAWRTRGIKNRMEFFRRALGHYLAHLGAMDAAAMFAAGADVAG